MKTLDSLTLKCVQDYEGSMTIDGLLALWKAVATLDLSELTLDNQDMTKAKPQGCTVVLCSRN